jgi:hypothetical protein
MKDLILVRFVLSFLGYSDASIIAELVESSFAKIAHQTRNMSKATKTLELESASTVLQPNSSVRPKSRLKTFLYQLQYLLARLQAVFKTNQEAASEFLLYQSIRIL